MSDVNNTANGREVAAQAYLDKNVHDGRWHNTFGRAFKAGWDARDEEIRRLKEEIQKLHSITNNYVTFTDGRIERLKEYARALCECLGSVGDEQRFAGPYDFSLGDIRRAVILKNNTRKD